VVDNYGDIGVCWRLAADLAARGQRIRLWIDEPGALMWMAPGALEVRWPGIEVRAWDTLHNCATVADLAPADIWVEGFGCDVPDRLQEHTFQLGKADSEGNRKSATPVWINLEYLTAEGFAQRNHGLPSPLLQGPARGHTRFFFYPGFSAGTGGLLREPDLAKRQAVFDRAGWLADQGIAWHGEQLVSLFCYEPAALESLLDLLRQSDRPTRLLVTHGRATAAVRRLIAERASSSQEDPFLGAPGSLSVTFLRPLSQSNFDHLLWSCDLNFVRGEDSLVRAIWARKAFVWQIYPQHDDAHHVKLQAFLDVMKAPVSWRAFHLHWNGIGQQALPQLDLAAWGAAVSSAGDRLLQLPDLSTRLLEFVRRAKPGTEQGRKNAKMRGFAKIAGR
jgi:uncharacterized repeat protein (TIGR03837 family)